METEDSQVTLENQVLQRFEVEELEKRYEFSWRAYWEDFEKWG